MRSVLRSDDPAEGNLKRVIDCLVRGDINRAKDVWVSFLMDEIGPFEVDETGRMNLEGGLMNMFLQFFVPTFQMNGVTECSNGPLCGRPSFCYLSHQYLIDIDPPLRSNSAQSQIDKFFGGVCSEPCTYPLSAESVQAESFEKCSRVQVQEVLEIGDDDKISTTVCHERLCNGVRTKKQITLAGRCWMLPLSVQKLPAVEMLDLPDEIVADGKRFYLRGVCASHPGHFVGYIRKQRNWYYYCGILDSSGSRVSFPRVGDKLEVAIYTI